MSSLFRVVPDATTSALEGQVVFSPVKSLWITAMTLSALLGGWRWHSAGDLAVFLLTTGITLCLGHSLGMHRRLIHSGYDCPRGLEYAMVYLGTLVGLAGPFGMVRTHDLRDWAQRQPVCHDYFAHRQPFFTDAFWQMHCDLLLRHPPAFRYEARVGDSRFYRFLETTWMLQQLPVALLLYMMGGWGWVVWGVPARVAVSVTGHWLIGHFAHRGGGRSWHVRGAGVQGYDIPFCGLITMGECWHNNHHAFPGSARIGLYAGQSDPGWWMLRVMQSVSLAWNIKTPEHLPPRHELQEL